MTLFFVESIALEGRSTVGYKENDIVETKRQSRGERSEGPKTIDDSDRCHTLLEAETLMFLCLAHDGHPSLFSNL